MIKNLIKIVKLVAPYKWWMLLATFVGFLTVGSGIGLLMTSAFIIAKAALHPDIGQLQVGIVGVRFFGITRGLFRYLERLLSHNITFKLLAKFRVWFFKSIVPLYPSKMGEFTSGDLLSRVVSDVESLEHIFIRVISPPVIALFTALVMITLFASFSVSLILPFILPFIVAGTLVPFVTYKLSNKYSEEYLLLKAKLNEYTIDSISGKNELLSFGMINSFNSKFNKTNFNLIKIERKMKLVEGLNESLIGLFMNIAVVIIFIQASKLAMNNIIDGVSIAVVVMGTMASFEALFPIPEAVQYLKRSLMASERVFYFTDKRKEEEKISTENISCKKIEFENVSFAYKENEEVLKNISLEITQDKKIAIIGGTGAGKSSVINLLLKFWKVNHGQILMDGISYQEIPQENIIDNLAVIPQSVFLFSDTVKGNLRIAKQNATDEEMWKALEQAELKTFIELLPQKLNTWIGNQGEQLSGGERKRLAIARAILKGKNFILCDEITADLDSINEEKIVNTIHRISEGKSLLFITHRLIGMEKFDRIYLLEKGKIVASDSHLNLLQNSTQYKSFFEV